MKIEEPCYAALRYDSIPPEQENNEDYGTNDAPLKICILADGIPRSPGISNALKFTRGPMVEEAASVSLLWFVAIRWVIDTGA